MRDSAPAAAVRVRVGASVLALPAEIVREVTDVTVLTPLPGAAPAILGLASHRGAPLTVVSAHRLRGAEPTGDLLVVCALPPGRVGLLVDEVLGVGGEAEAWDLGAIIAPLFQTADGVRLGRGG